MLIARNAQRECPQSWKHGRQERGQFGDSHRLGRVHLSTIGLSGKTVALTRTPGGRTKFHTRQQILPGHFIFTASRVQGGQDTRRIKASEGICHMSGQPIIENLCINAGSDTHCDTDRRTER
ncbi:hypothetical protein [Paraburkholderia sp. JHI869]|uniref:hypothetical protein n=1 Tax=Paraburkholderia sp. JHI869 TaxID=3112959 RepID=UPI00316FD95D